MKRGVIIFSSVIFCLGSCATKEHKIADRHFLLESPLPTQVLEAYLKKANLDDINFGVDSFEVRNWYPFYYVDSFPVVLERIYFSDSIMKAECYLFCDKNGGLLTSKNEMNEMMVEKYFLKKLPLRYLDSLQTTYSLSGIDTFDMNIIKKKNEIGASTATGRYVLLEQATSKKYYAAFFSDPEYYLGLHPSIDKYGAFSRFTQEIFFQNDTSFRSWFVDKTRKIISKR